MKREVSLDKIEIILNNFRMSLNALYPMKDGTWDAVREHTRFASFKKHEFILTAGNIPKNIYFLGEGCVCIYYHDKQGRKYIKNLMFENSFPAATSALLQNKPSQLTIEPLEDSSLIVWNYEIFRSMLEKFPDLKNGYLRYLELYWIIDKEKTELALATESAMSRYQSLLAKHPYIEDRVPLHIIASHLGITPTQLSRIRKEISSSQHM